MIRGTAPRLNSVTINGERIPSAEAESRTVQLDLVPADMIQSIEVNKAVTPDMDADAIGGSVNLITRAAPNGLRVSGTVGSGYNFLREEPIYLGSVVIGNRFADGKLGVLVSGSVHDHKLGSHNYEAEWDQGALDEFQIRLYELQRIRRSVSTTLDYAFNENNSITFKALYNHRDDWENRFRVDFDRFDDNGNGTAFARIQRETKGVSEMIVSITDALKINARWPTLSLVSTLPLLVSKSIGLEHTPKPQKSVQTNVTLRMNRMTRC